MAAKKRSTIPTPRFLIKRVYAPAEESDGLRGLVDRLWPRGIAKEKARIDLWLKDLAPSDALRRRVHGDPKQWENFVIEYRHELAREPALSAVANLHDRARNGPVTLLYAARNETRNNAVALREWLRIADDEVIE